MGRIAVGIEYDGSGFAGWQSQRELRTVQGELERALSSVADSPVAVVVAGRTDAGVHANGQVAHFDTAAVRSVRAWTLGANTTLPGDVSVLWARPVPDHFHARYSAEARSYRYRILNRLARPAIAAQRVTWVHRPLDVAAMRAATAALVGEHDFSAFRSIECQSRSPIRRVDAIEVVRHGEAIAIDITANAFLHHMARNLAGLLIAIGQGDLAPSAAREVLATRDRQRAPATAPANGLYLRSIRYSAAFGLPGDSQAAADPASPDPADPL